MRLAAFNLLVLAAAVLAATALGSTSTRSSTTLHGKVGPGFTISLRDDSGNAVRNLAPGDYEIEVEDEGDIHNFHLFGPGVNEATDVGGTGKVTWRVTLKAGTYTFQCDPHSSTMHGTFTVGGSTGTTTTTPTPKPKPMLMKLTGTVGPGFTITLTESGKKVRTAMAGRYRITIRDRSAMHDFTLVRLTGKHVKKRLTTVKFVGRKSVVVTLTRGTWRYYCEPHASVMKGTFKVV